MAEIKAELKANKAVSAENLAKKAIEEAK